jgi:hypothetical protein
MKDRATSGLEPRRSLRAAVLAALISSALSCAWFAHATASPASPRPPITQLIDADANIAARNLFCGPGGCDPTARPIPPLRLRERHNRGSSPNIVVEDARGRVWNAKLGAEVKPEIAASRLIWAIGFHQPSMYYVPSWTLVGGPDGATQRAARFRLERTEWKRDGQWDWQDNPFVGTRELRGLVVLMVMITNWDLKTSNNVIYERQRGGSPHREYVVKDLGVSFGRSVRFYTLGTQNDIDDFNHERFIEKVDGDRVEFGFQPLILNLHVAHDIKVDDVVWTCRRLAKLSDRQWRGAFRAAGYTDEEAAPFIARLQQKMREGLALAERPTERS